MITFLVNPFLKVVSELLLNQPRDIILTMFYSLELFLFLTKMVTFRIKILIMSVNFFWETTSKHRIQNPN